MIGLIGYHESPHREAWSQAVSDGCRTFQIMLGNPRTYQVKPLHRSDQQYAQDKGLFLICHGPYVCSFVAEQTSDLYKKSREWLTRASKACIESGIKDLVIHVGGIVEGQSNRSAYNSLSSALLQWELDFGDRLTIHLENDAGSKNGRKVGIVTFVYPFVKKWNRPSVRMCLDTEHAYASGFPIGRLDYMEKLLEFCDIVHFNAIPSYVDRGSHLDRHSNTLFEDSKYPPEFYQEIDKIIQRKQDRRIILERASWEIAKEDRDMICLWRSLW